MDSGFEPPPPSTAIDKFSHSISEKLTSKNYLLWCQQVESMLKGHCLHHYLVNSQVPPKHLMVVDCNVDCVSASYLTWEQQDKLLLSWLQSSISHDILTRVFGCKLSWHLWDKIHVYFHLHMNAKAHQLRTKLRNTSLDNHTVSRYLFHIQALVDVLIAIGDAIPPCEQLDVILKGLSEDYELIVSLISSKFDPLSVNEVEMLLLAHEAHLDKFKKAHVAQVSAFDQHIVPHSTNTNNTQVGFDIEVVLVAMVGTQEFNAQCAINMDMKHLSVIIWYSAPWNTYHYQSHGFPIPNNQYVRPTPSSFVPSKLSHLTTSTSLHTMMATVDPYSSVNHWYPDSGASLHVTNGLNIQYAGVTKFLPPTNSKIPPVLNNLLFVPLITKNLDYSTLVIFSTWPSRLGHPGVDDQCNTVIFLH
ncbi:hypothetical protein CR513_01249, partial [Mucuna pruriens]